MSEPPLTHRQAGAGCLGLVLAPLSTGAALLVGYFVSPGAGMLVGASLGLVLTLLWLGTLREAERSWKWVGAAAAFTIGCVLSALTSFGLLDSVNFLLGRWPTVGVAEALQVQADPFELRDGTLRAEFAYPHVVKPRANQVRYGLVAPLVPQGWSRDSEIAVWLACSPDEDNEQDARRACLGLFAGRRLGSPANVHYADTVRRAEAQHGLRSAKSAVVLELGDFDPVNAWSEVGFICFVVLVASGLLVALTNRLSRNSSAPRATAG